MIEQYQKTDDPRTKQQDLREDISAAFKAIVTDPIRHSRLIERINKKLK